MAAFDAFDVEIRPIMPGDRLTGLSLGHEKYTPLKILAQRHALTYERQSLARTYAAFNIAENDRMVGYITIVCGEVVTDPGEATLVHSDALKYLYNQYPAVKIARLAVDQRARGRGMGEALVNLALGIAQNAICPNVGCRFIMVDSKKDSVSFYGEKMGFTMLDTEANRQRDEPVMFVDLAKV